MRSSPPAETLDEAAQVLGIEPSTLWRKRKRHGLLIRWLRGRGTVNQNRLPVRGAPVDTDPAAVRNDELVRSRARDRRRRLTHRERGRTGRTPAPRARARCPRPGQQPRSARSRRRLSPPAATVPPAGGDGSRCPAGLRTRAAAGPRRPVPAGASSTGGTTSVTPRSRARGSACAIASPSRARDRDTGRISTTSPLWMRADRATRRPWPAAVRGRRARCATVSPRYACRPVRLAARGRAGSPCGRRQRRAAQLRDGRDYVVAQLVEPSQPRDFLQHDGRTGRAQGRPVRPPSSREVLLAGLLPHDDGLVDPTGT